MMIRSSKTIRRSCAARGKQPNLSFFAFTATPNRRPWRSSVRLMTTESPIRFTSTPCARPSRRGSSSMCCRTTLPTNLLSLVESHRRGSHLNKRKAARAIARFLSLHPHNLAQKTEVIIEHFRQSVMPKIGGKAKAMVVTSSRPHVVRYKESFDAYLAKRATQTSRHWWPLRLSPTGDGSSIPRLR